MWPSIFSSGPSLTGKFMTYRSSLGNKKQALNDLNICNNLDEKFTMVYLERAKLHFSNENVTKGL